jgi:hypothetical protein
MPINISRRFGFIHFLFGLGPQMLLDLFERFADMIDAKYGPHYGYEQRKAYQRRRYVYHQGKEWIHGIRSFSFQA